MDSYIDKTNPLNKIPKKDNTSIVRLPEYIMIKIPRKLKAKFEDLVNTNVGEIHTSNGYSVNILEVAGRFIELHDVSQKEYVGQLEDIVGMFPLVNYIYDRLTYYLFF